VISAMYQQTTSSASRGINREVFARRSAGVDLDDGFGRRLSFKVSV
jgi:hypothetical protein